MPGGSLSALTDPLLQNKVMAAVGDCRASTEDARIPVRPRRETASDDARPSQKNPAFAGKTRRKGGCKSSASQAESFPGGTARTRSRRPASQANPPRRAVQGRRRPESEPDRALSPSVRHRSTPAAGQRYPPRPGGTDRGAKAGGETGTDQADKAQRLSDRLERGRAAL